MTVCYRDPGGIVAVEIDSSQIDFVNGEAYFDCGGEEYRIQINNILTICERRQ